MSVFGLQVKSATDGSVILDSNSMNSVYLGKPTYITQSAFSVILGQQVVTMQYQIQGSPNTAPAVFVGAYGADAGIYKVYNTIHLGNGVWRINVLGYGSPLEVPTLYCFGDATLSGFSTPGSYGLQLKNSANMVTFDSRWGKQLLQVKYIWNNNNVPSNIHVLPSSLVKPAVMWHSNAMYGAFLNTTSPTTFFGASNLAGIPVNTKDFVNGFIYVSQIGNATYNSAYHGKFFPAAESTVCAAIDGADYD